MTTVVDTSVLITWLSDPTSDELLRKRLRRGVIHAPTLVDAEVLNAIRGLLLGGKVPPERGLEMLRDFTNLRIKRHAMTPHLRRVMELHNNLNAYDAMYVAIAEYLRVPLLTRDAKIKRAPGHKADIHVYP